MSSITQSNFKNPGGLNSRSPVCQVPIDEACLLCLWLHLKGPAKRYNTIWKIKCHLDSEHPGQDYDANVFLNSLIEKHDEGLSCLGCQRPGHWRPFRVCIYCISEKPNVRCFQCGKPNGLPKTSLCVTCLREHPELQKLIEVKCNLCLMPEMFHDPELRFQHAKEYAKKHAEAWP